MVGGEVFLTDFSEDEDLQPDRRLIRCQDTSEVDIHAGREARYCAVDVVGARPIVILSLLKRFLARNGFSVGLVYGEPDLCAAVDPWRVPRRQVRERPAFLGPADLWALGLDPPDSEPVMGSCTTSPCHAALVDRSLTPQRWVHDWDSCPPGLLAILFIDWEVSSDRDDSYIPLNQALDVYGLDAISMYLMATHYSELLPPIHDGLRATAMQVAIIRRALEGLQAHAPSPPALACHREAVEDALADDLNTPAAFLSIFDWIHDVNTLTPRTPVGDRDLREMLALLGMSDLAMYPAKRPRHPGGVVRAPTDRFVDLDGYKARRHRPRPSKSETNKQNHP